MREDHRHRFWKSKPLRPTQLAPGFWREIELLQARNNNVHDTHFVLIYYFPRWKAAYDDACRSSLPINTYSSCSTACEFAKFYEQTSYVMSPQTDGTIGNFRPAHDIFEDAASRLSQESKASAIRGQDIVQLTTLDCVRDALKRICDSKGSSVVLRLLLGSSQSFSHKDVTEELTVYRYSHSKLMENISAKVARLSQSNEFAAYPSLQRQLAKDGLLVEGRDDDLRQCKIQWLLLVVPH